MLRLFLLVFLASTASVLQAQLSSPFSFSHYSMKDGLASNEVTSITQDRTGFLWIASNNGLQRFDGVQFKHFRHRENDPASIPNNLIVQVFADKDDNLWVLSANGLIGIFDKNTFTYKPVAVKARRADLLPSAEKRLLTDEYGHLFLLLRGVEVILYDKKKGMFDYTSNFIPFISERPGITSVSQQPGTQKYWLGLQGGGIAIFNRKTGNVSYLGHNVENEPAIELFGDKISFTHSLFDRKGRVWFENWGKMGGPYAVQYDPRRKQNPIIQYQFYDVLKSYHEVHGFLEESSGRIWMRGVQLLALFNEEEQRFNIIPNDYRNEQGIQYEHVQYLFEDREKNIWVATRHHGLYRFNPSMQYFLNITHKHPLHDQQGVGSVMSFMELKNGDIITGAWGDGLYRYDPKLRLKPFGIKDLSPNRFPSIWDMHASADSNTIWMACQPGLYTLDQAKGTMSYRNPPILNNRTVRQVIEDKQGHLWLGMHAYGLFRWFHPKNTRMDSIVRVEEAGTSMVNQLVIDSRDWLWASTGASGLFVFDTRDGKLVRRWHAGGKGADTVLGNAISGVLEYNDSLVFITTATDFFFYNRHQNTVTRFPFRESLMGAIASHQKDDAGFIWVGTTNALYRFHPFLRSLQMFNRFHGINNDNFVLSAAYKRRDGTMLFGNDVSFIAFDPRKVRPAGRHLPVAFTSLQIGRNELRIDSVLQLDRLVLSPSDNSLTVEFSSLVFAHDLPIQYKLDGIDDDWHTADRSQRAMFPFLPPGNYTLRLRSINADGIPSPNHTVLNIFIRSPFYQTWWFYSLLAVSVALLLYWFDRQRTKRKEALQKVRTDIASGLHEEVNTALNNINILSEIARLKSDREPQRAKEYLEQIHTKSHNMIIAMDDMLWSLDPQNDTMDKTISRIKEFTDALMQRHGVLIELLIDKKVEKLELNMKLRHEAFLLFKEGLRSLVTAGTRLCIVHMTAERNKLLFTIEFENEGCDMQQLNNLLHRRDMEARLHSLRARLNVQVHKSRSVFSLQLPLS